MRTWLLAIMLLFAPTVLSGCAISTDEHTIEADDDAASGRISLGEEYKDYARTTPGGRGESSDEIWEKVFYYLPNRVLDFIDIFRADVGVGPTAGGVIRLTKYFQTGARFVTPFSVRVGNAGRRSPIFVETSNEFGVGGAFVESRDRVIEPVEVGVGLDAFLVGAYLGINFTEVPDFLAGFFFFDPSEDDL